MLRESSQLIILIIPIIPIIIIPIVFYSLPLLKCDRSAIRFISS